MDPYSPPPNERGVSAPTPTPGKALLMNSRDDTAPGGASRSGGTIAAIIRVRAPSGRLRCFEAETVEITGPFVNSTGRWRDDRECRRTSDTWGPSAVLEIRYEDARAAA